MQEYTSNSQDLDTLDLYRSQQQELGKDQYCMG